MGSNLGDRLCALQGGLDGLAGSGAGRVVAVSGVYESAPVGGPRQPDYLNAVALVETRVAPERLLEVAHEIEGRWQRRRTVRWGPRTLDIDILSFGVDVLESERLTLPHPRAAQRWFVMLPWAEVDGGYLVPRGDGSMVVADGSMSVAGALAALRLVDPDGERACVKRLDLALRLPEPNTLGR